jgi:choline dehydrogenase-like flavoprotein
MLAEAGCEVVVLEEGGDYLGEALTRRDSLYDALYQDGAARTTADRSISVLQGRVLGGGTVINASDVVPIHEQTLHHWVKRFGLGDFAPDKLAPYQALASQDLRANPIDPRLASRGNHVLEQGSRKLGLEGEHMLHNRVGCIGLGKCMVGCAINAKQNVRLVSLPVALQHGCRVFTRARAVRIDDAPFELKRVRVRTLDATGHHARSNFTISARVVIVAANAINSALLLQQSGLGNEHVGRHLTLQPQLFVHAVFPEPLHSYRGIPQSYAITHHEEHSDEHGLWGFRVEGLFATPGAHATTLGRAGALGQELMASYDRMATVLCLIPDLPSGRVTPGLFGGPNIDYTPRPDVHARMKAAAKVAARSYLAAGAQKVVVPVGRPLEVRSEADLARVDALQFRPADAPIISAHQQGTVRFAGSARDGGANPEGEVYGTRGVYVFDSSGYPSTSSSHTMHPIISTARMLSAQLAARLGR